MDKCAHKTHPCAAKCVHKSNPTTLKQPSKLLQKKLSLDAHSHCSIVERRKQGKHVSHVSSQRLLKTRHKQKQNRDDCRTEGNTNRPAIHQTNLQNDNKAAQAPWIWSALQFNKNPMEDFIEDWNRDRTRIELKSPIKVTAGTTKKMHGTNRKESHDRDPWAPIGKSRSTLPNLVQQLQEIQNSALKS